LTVFARFCQAPVLDHGNCGSLTYLRPKGPRFVQRETDVSARHAECSEPHSHRDRAMRHSRSKPNASFQAVRYL
jgi:hypothetical protein